jgi:hypothetical protein
MLIKINTFGLPFVAEPGIRVVIRGSDYVWVLI